MSHRFSELLLIVLFVILLGFIRVYWGGNPVLIIVWKEHFTYNDTFINLPQILKLSGEELARQHPSVLWQLEEMGLLETKIPARTKLPRPSTSLQKTQRPRTATKQDLLPRK